jgi:phytoene/squalene synthetase
MSQAAAQGPLQRHDVDREFYLLSHFFPAMAAAMETGLGRREALYILLRMAVDHYENFPVASILLPPRLREPVAAIYWFARSADDFADEGERRPAERRACWPATRPNSTPSSATNRRGTRCSCACARSSPHYELPLQLFRDLLDAFMQDIGQGPLCDFAELMDYCRRSADPVGRLLLHLFGHATTREPVAFRRHLLGAATDQPLAGRRHRRRQGRSRPHLPAAGRHGALRCRRRDILAPCRQRRLSALLRFQVDRARA